MICGFSRLANPDDCAVFDPDVSFDDPEHRIDYEHVRKDEIQRPLGGRDAPMHSEAVAERLATAEHTLVTGDEMIALDLRPQVCITEANPVSDSRTKELRVFSAAYRP